MGSTGMSSVLRTRVWLLPLPLLFLARGDRAASTAVDVAPAHPVRVAARGATGQRMPKEPPRKRPLSFEANQGQTDSEVKFLSRGKGYSLFVTAAEAVLVVRRPTMAATRSLPGTRHTSLATENPEFPPAVMRMRLAGASPAAEVKGLDQLPGRANYFVGRDAKRWRTNVATFARVRCTSVYPGVDLVYHGTQGQLEYDFVVAPRADPAVIRITFPGAERMRIDPDGDLILDLGGGEVRHHRPVVYQEVAGARREISGDYVLRGEGQVGFSVSEYDRARPLIIDPVLVYSTFLGGSGDGLAGHDEGHGIAVDALGNIYVTGVSGSVDFPTVNAFQPTRHGTQDAFVTKLSPDGSTLLYSTYLGGAVGDDRNCPPLCGAGTQGNDIKVDASGNAYVSGITSTLDFPITPGAFLAPAGSVWDAFVTKLSADGSSLVYSTVALSKCYSCHPNIAVDSTGSAWFVDSTDRPDIPIVNPLQSTLRGPIDAVILRLNPTGTALLYSTYLGGSANDFGRGIAVDAADNVYLVGATGSTDFPTVNPVQSDHGGLSDCWVAELNPDGSTIVYATYLGGSDHEVECRVAIDDDGNSYVAGTTMSTDFPTRNALQPIKRSAARGEDAFVSKLDPGGSFVYSTFLGGSDEDSAWAVAADAGGNAYLTGISVSTDFPTVAGLQPFGGPPGPFGGGDAFVTKVDPAGSRLVYSTYLGGSIQDYGLAIAADSMGAAYVTGLTLSPDFPTASAVQPAFGGGYDAFIVKISDPPCPEDVTDQVDVFRSRLHGILFTRLRFQWVVIRNTTTDPIQGPLAYVMEDLQGATFLGSRLKTACFSPSGDPFVAIHVGSDDVLGPDEWALGFLLFFKTRPGQITYSPTVLGGIPTQAPTRGPETPPVR